MFCFNIDYGGLTRPQICTCHDNTVAVLCSITMTRHNGRDGVSNHQPHDCLLNSLFGLRSKKTSKFRVTGLCGGNSPGTGEFPAQMAGNAENVSIWWRHHENSDVTRSLLIVQLFVCMNMTNRHILLLLLIHAPYWIANSLGDASMVSSWLAWSEADFLPFFFFLFFFSVFRCR